MTEERSLRSTDDYLSFRFFGSGKFSTIYVLYIPNTSSLLNVRKISKFLENTFFVLATNFGVAIARSPG